MLARALQFNHFFFFMMNRRLQQRAAGPRIPYRVTWLLSGIGMS
jgi:hypothetical protein